MTDKNLKVYTDDDLSAEKDDFEAAEETDVFENIDDGIEFHNDSREEEDEE